MCAHDVRRLKDVRFINRIKCFNDLGQCIDFIIYYTTVCAYTILTVARYDYVKNLEKKTKFIEKKFLCFHKKNPRE